MGLGVLVPMALVLGVVTLLNTQAPEPGPSAEPDTVPVAEPEPATTGNEAPEQVTETASSATPNGNPEPADSSGNDASATDSSEDEPRRTTTGPLPEKPASAPHAVEKSGPPPARDGKAFRPNGI